MALPRVVEVTKTTTACPAQWEGKLEDGCFLYIRFRHGRLYVGCGRTMEVAVWPEGDGSILLLKSVGDMYDGYMEFEELQEHTKHVLDWQCNDTDEWDDTLCGG